MTPTSLSRFHDAADKPLEIPPACSWAYKEWLGVLDAFKTGEQSILLRKGGIAEGPGGFLPEHPVFWLYPTELHQAEQGLKRDSLRPLTESSAVPGRVAIELLVVSVQAMALDRWEQVEALEPFHVWTRQTIQRRFAYRSPGLWLLVPRVFQRTSPVLIPDRVEHQGCKTWVALEEALQTAGVRPVLSDAEWRDRIDHLSQALLAGGGPSR